MEKQTDILLTDVPVGTRVRIRRLALQPEMTTRLRELGFSEDSIIRPLTQSNGSIVCEVHNSRIGLNHAVARSILVSAL